jgi:monoamine oxidase
MDDRWERVEAVLEKMEGASEGPDQSFAEFVQKCCAGAEWDDAREMATAYVEGFNAAWADRISVKSLAEDQRAARAIDESQQFRVLSGYDGVVAWLAAGLEPHRAAVHLSTVVTAVRWRRGAVEVEVRSRAGDLLEPVNATCAIVTLPLGVLCAPPDWTGSVRFAPELVAKKEAISKLAMGPVVKVMLQFREAFWEEERFAGLPAKSSLRQMAFIHSRDPFFPTWWTQLPVRAALLTAWAGGAPTEKLSKMGPQFMLDHAVSALGRVLNIPRERVEMQLQAWHVHDWQEDPFARGAYSFALVGGAEARRALAEAVEETLFFAGEATNVEGQSGTVAGAIATGRRAAAEVMGSLSRRGSA